MINVTADEHYEGHEEEGEYHFSDDEANYDVDAGTTKVAEPSTQSPRDKIIQGLKKYRRMLIGLTVFFVLIFIVYKMLAPTSAPQQSTEFSQTMPAKTVSKAPVSMTPPKVVSPTPADTLQVSTQAPASSVQPPAITAPPAVAAYPSTPAQIAPPQASVNPAPTQQMPAAPAQASPLPAGFPSQPVTTQPPPAPIAPTVDVNAEQTKMIMDRLAALEEQNSKLVSLLQNQVAQKFSETDAENKATEDKVRVLNKRLGNIEASLNKMAQLLRDEGISKSSMTVGNPGLPSNRPMESKVSYTVQAIIPGRAWLKSEAGDTVTVAEGDMLRDYGRITKIDPYDGIVEIDTGRKIITLSYGTTGD